MYFINDQHEVLINNKIKAEFKEKFLLKAKFPFRAPGMVKLEG